MIPTIDLIFEIVKIEITLKTKLKKFIDTKHEGKHGWQRDFISRDIFERIEKMRKSQSQLIACWNIYQRNTFRQRQRHIHFTHSSAGQEKKNTYIKNSNNNKQQQIKKFWGILPTKKRQHGKTRLSFEIMLTFFSREKRT